MFLSLWPSMLIAQGQNILINDQIISQLPPSAQIVGLGDPTHQESTITEYRIDLIKKLVVEKGFKIIAIEGNLFELYRAHINCLENGDIAHYEQSMYSMLNATEMESLYQFVYCQNKAGNPVKIVGFDPHFSGTTYADQMASALEDTELLKATEQADFIEVLRKAQVSTIKALFRNNKILRKKVNFYVNKILSNYRTETIDQHFIKQALKNLAFLYTEEQIADKRDLLMAQNIEFLQEIFPRQKIILFGSSTHLLKNPKSIETAFFQHSRSTTLGHEIAKKSGTGYLFIGYSAISGSRSNLSNKPKALNRMLPNSIEFQLSQQSNENAFYLNSNIYPMGSTTNCRFLGHSFVPLNIWEVMDGLVLIRGVKPFRIKKLSH